VVGHFACTCSCASSISMIVRAFACDHLRQDARRACAVAALPPLRPGR
jgi:hypothetical protein